MKDRERKLSVENRALRAKNNKLMEDIKVLDFCLSLLTAIYFLSAALILI